MIKRHTTQKNTHNQNTNEKADLILVMDQGQIVERGNHAELLAQNGYYARLHAKQFEEGDEQPQVLEQDA